MLPYRQIPIEQATVTRQGTAGSTATVSLNDAIQRSQSFLLSMQFPDGYWWAELGSNVACTAQALLLFKVWGVDQRLPKLKIESYLRAQQCSHGGWELFHGDGGELSATVEAYMGLRLLNVPTSDPALQNARKFILDRGGLSKARVFTKMHLAFIGCYEWRGVPSLPPWVMLLPEWFPTTIYDVSYWARVCIVPLMIAFDSKPVFAIDPPISLDELFVTHGKTDRYALPRRGDWTDWFVTLDNVFKLLEKYNLVPFRERALKVAEQWMLERAEVSGEFGGFCISMYYSLLAMRVRGYSVSDPNVENGLQAVINYSMETEDQYSVQCSISPVWDTAFVMRALVDSGLSRNHPSLQRGGDWLLRKQILHHGDWMVKNKRGRPGGWAFEFHNRLYPDLDDTAAVVLALNEVQLPNEPMKQAAIARAVDWLATMQCKAGGWGSFDLNNDQAWLNSVPFGDLKAMIDPNTADITGRVLEMEGRLRRRSGVSLLSKQVVDRALAYLRKEQEPEGCWYGRWGVNYIYGTCWALEALALISPKEHEQEIARAARWLVECQKKNKNEDGGWTETCYSYTDPSLKGQGELTTASQTAWALMGLLAAGSALEKYETTAIERGVQYLLQTQRSDGSWHEDAFTGTGFPGHFYMKYHFYPQHFPLVALSRYRALLLQQAGCPEFKNLPNGTTQPNGTHKRCNSVQR